jgi:UDP-galactopyranose mutase
MNEINLNKTNLNILCFSHLRWDFVFQRPQHLLTLAAKNGNKVFFFEEPVFNDEAPAHFKKTYLNNITVLTPVLPASCARKNNSNELENLINMEIVLQNITGYISWYYTPMAMEFTESLNPGLVVYDCMDELSAFKEAPPGMKENEEKLFSYADIVFTGGRSLYDSKKTRHSNVFLFPSSIDTAHFSSQADFEPHDQYTIKGDKIGYFGVIDERFDLDLLKNMAEQKPEWNFVILGPVVKISPESLPKAKNIFYLGQKDYKDLPSYIQFWDAAIIPFADNESTKFISPTKVLEYLAAGKPVVSTPIKDIVFPYGANNIVKIADNAEDFAGELEVCLKNKNDMEWKRAVEKMLRGTSWEKTWDEMQSIIINLLKNKSANTLEYKGKEEACLTI